MKPVICSYYLTYRCNARCPFCAIHNDTSVPRERESTHDVVARNLGDAKRLGVKFVDFTGGEPLLYGGLPRVLAYAKDIGLRTTLTSNGILYPNRAREIAGLVDILQFSLHGPDRETHDAVTVTPSFDRVMESVETARAFGDRPTFIHTVTNDSIGRTADVIALARKLHVPLFLNPCFEYFGNEGLFREHIGKLELLARGRGVSVDLGYLRFLADGGNRTSHPRCLAVSSNVVISPDDRLVLPCWHHRTAGIPIGGRLFALRNSPEVHKAIGMEGRYPFCEGCAVNCSMRASLIRRFDRYFLPTVRSAAKYLRELYRWR